MSFFTKLRLTLAIKFSKFRTKKRKVDFGAPSPHSRRWDEREKAESLGRRQMGGPTTRGLSVRMLALIGVLFAVSLLADLLLPALIGTAVGLVLLGGTLAYFFYLRQRPDELLS